MEGSSKPVTSFLLTLKLPSHLQLVTSPAFVQTKLLFFSLIIQMSTVTYTHYLFYLTADYVTLYPYQKQQLVKLKPYVVVNVTNVIPHIFIYKGFHIISGHIKQAFAYICICKMFTSSMSARPSILQLHVLLKITFQKPEVSLKIIHYTYGVIKPLSLPYSCMLCNITVQRWTSSAIA